MDWINSVYIDLMVALVKGDLVLIIDACFTRFVDRSQIIKAHANLW